MEGAGMQEMGFGLPPRTSGEKPCLIPHPRLPSVLFSPPTLHYENSLSASLFFTPSGGSAD